jgi:membrane protein DedA with SNARE-associated domain
MAAVFAVLWAAGMLWQSPSIDLRSVVTAIVAGALAGGLMSWLFGKLSGGIRG